MRQQSLFDTPAVMPPAVVEKILDDDNLDEFFSDSDYADPERQVPHTAEEFNEFERDYRARVAESNQRWARGPKHGAMPRGIRPMSH